MITNGYQAIERLRPQWLVSRKASAMVYWDNVRYGGITALRDIAAANVAQIRYLDAYEVTTRFGTGHMNRATIVTSKLQ